MQSAGIVIQKHRKHRKRDVAKGNEGSEWRDSERKDREQKHSIKGKVKTAAEEKSTNLESEGVLDWGSDGKVKSSVGLKQTQLYNVLSDSI